MSSTIVVDPPPAAAQDGSALPPGTRLDRYRLLRVLGRGSFGITYEAEHEALPLRVAIKEYYPVASAMRAAATAAVRPHDTDPARASFDEGLKRFRREGQMLARLDHPGVVPVRDVIGANGTAYLVMDMVPGEPLAAILERGRPDPDTVERLTRDLLEALAALHEAGVFHCDIKPENIMVRPDGRPVLIDLGSARMDRRLQPGGQTTVALTVTLAYAPPELLSSPPDIQAAADLFELGTTLYGAIAGALPPDAMQRLSSLNAKRGDPLVPLSRTRPKGYAHAFLAAIDAAMALNRDDRLATAGEWLRRLRTGGGRRRPWIAAVALTALGGLTAGLSSAGLPESTALGAGAALAGGTLFALSGRLSVAGVLTAWAAVPAFAWLGARLGRLDQTVQAVQAVQADWLGLTGASPAGLDFVAVAVAVAVLVRLWGWMRRGRGAVAAALSLSPGLVMLAAFADAALNGGAVGNALVASGAPPTMAGTLGLTGGGLQAVVVALGLLTDDRPLSGGGPSDDGPLSGGGRS